MIIPYQLLDKKTLRGVIEEFVTRDGTDFTDVETMIQSIEEQLQEGAVKIVYDETTKSCNIVRSDSIES